MKSAIQSFSFISLSRRAGMEHGPRQLDLAQSKYWGVNVNVKLAQAQG